MSNYTQTKRWADMIDEEMDFTIPAFQLSPTKYRNKKKQANKPKKLARDSEIGEFAIGANQKIMWECVMINKIKKWVKRG